MTDTRLKLDSHKDVACPFRDTIFLSLMSYSLDVCTYSLLNHEVKTCDGVDSRSILVRPVDIVHPAFPILPTIGLSPLLRLVEPSAFRYPYR
jgi:hypothetical protein